jgi:hypothetical protein
MVSEGVGEVIVRRRSGVLGGWFFFVLKVVYAESLVGERLRHLAAKSRLKPRLAAA